jgi:hypothetical protein
VKTKNIVTVILLVFIIASVAFLILKESKEEPEGRSAKETAAGRDRGSIETPGGKQESAGQDHIVIAYYFHTTRRCPTCRKIESYTTESIKTAFARQLQSGRLEFHVVNVDEPGNKHYIDDYQLTTKSVVLTDYRDGEEVRWKNLDLVWHHVGDKKVFMDYIETETRDYLGERSNE